MRKALLVLAGLLLAASAAQAQQRRTISPVGTGVKGNPTLEFMIGPMFGSGTLRGFDDPRTFEQDLNYTGFFLNSGLTLPIQPRVALLFKGDFNWLRSKADFPVVVSPVGAVQDIFEIQRTAGVVKLGFGVRIELK